MSLQNQKQILNSEIIKIIYNAADGNKSLKRVGVFGSYARGEQTTESDIDIVYEDIYTEAYLDDLDDFASKIRSNLSKVLNKPELEIDFVTIKGLDSGLMKDLNQSIIKSILSDVIWIYEK
ncbi:MAG: nucleotidyltransferase domain-containing protein [Oscillospiraceae bacterium]|nr:nucleotidyltransferase domain-containing protein [Oscillospiraceae bacterium]